MGVIDGGAQVGVVGGGAEGAIVDGCGIVVDEDGKTLDALTKKLLKSV